MKVVTPLLLRQNSGKNLYSGEVTWKNQVEPFPKTAEQHQAMMEVKLSTIERLKEQAQSNVSPYSKNYFNSPVY
jgi:hypothetical protein